MLSLCIAVIEKHDLPTVRGWIKLKYPPNIYRAHIYEPTGIGASTFRGPMSAPPGTVLNPYIKRFT